MSCANDAIAPRRAPVVPRARRPSGQACLPVEELLLPILRNHTPGAIYLYAPPGGGKTTALSHLRAVLPPDVKVGLLDDPKFDRWTPDGPSKSVVATSHLPTGPNLATFHLAFWGEDEWLEYLVANHHEKCASVLKRLRADPTVPTLDGCPELLRIVMDRMATNESLTTTSDALRRHWWDLAPPGDDRDNGMAVCLRHLNGSPATAEELEPHVPPRVLRFLRHAAAQRVVAAEAVAQILCDVSEWRLRDLRVPQNPRSFREIVAAVRLRPAAVQRLEQLINDTKRRPADALAASVLVALDPRWRPQSGRELRLNYAILTGGIL